MLDVAIRPSIAVILVGVWWSFPVAFMCICLVANDAEAFVWFDELCISLECVSFPPLIFSWLYYLFTKKLYELFMYIRGKSCVYMCSDIHLSTWSTDHTQKGVVPGADVTC